MILGDVWSDIKISEKLDMSYTTMELYYTYNSRLQVAEVLSVDQAI